MIVELKTVTSAIDATAYEDAGKGIAIRYVKEDGEIKEMIVSKAQAAGKSAPSKKGIKQKYISTHVKERALLKVLDHTDGAKYKSLFLFAIIGYNKDGELGPWATIKRGT